jgi:zinc transporter ZupT
VLSVAAAGLTLRLHATWVNKFVAFAVGALLFNIGSSLGSVVGGLVGYWALGAVQNWVPYALALAAASMIYVAVADLIPGLQRKVRLHDTLLQLVLLAAGIGIIAIVHHALAH